MARAPRHSENHVVDRLAWLRASVLGANDGILSTSSLILGVASAHGGPRAILIAGVSGLVAGAMSMAAGEYVSVSSQADSETADLARERQELKDDPEAERCELAGLYIRRGLDKDLALQVATRLMERDALAAHARDELGISDATAARPVLAGLSSAASFLVGGALPLAMALLLPKAYTIAGVSAASLLFLAMLGAVGAKTGGASMARAALRVTFWGAMAMAVTAGIGALFGIQVG